jgi:hypothetical protein
VPVDLGVSFPFFGLAYNHIWVSSAGYIAFEQPPQHEGFAELDAGRYVAHSVVMAATGEYDLTHPGATLSISRFDANEVEVAWHAPLFGNAKFSDVALRLGSNGSIGFGWERIVLDGSGSLDHTLLHVLHFDTLPPSESVGSKPEYAGASANTVTLAVGAGGHASIVDTHADVFNVTVGAIYGADAGEGLDFVGDFVYAVNIYGDDYRNLTIGDAVFTSDASTPGVTISQPTTPRREGLNKFKTFGPGLEDTNLALILATYRYAGDLDGHGSLTIQLDSLEEQSLYSLQLLTAEATWENWCFDVLVDDKLVVAQFDEAAIQGGLNTHASGAFIRYRFTAQATSMTITLKFDENCGWIYIQEMNLNADISGFTLERMGSPLYDTADTALGSALQLLDDAHIQLPPTTLGGSIAISVWTQVGTLWDGTEGITLFNSFHGTDCGDSDACRNAVGGVLDRHGWFAVGNDVAAKRPANLWVAGVTLDQETKTLFWESARDEWLMVTFTVSGHTLHVYTGGKLWGVGVLEAPLPRMLRQNNYVGAGRGAPFRIKTGGISLALADFRLYDRSLATAEVAALFADPWGEHTACCVAAGIKSPFGVGDIDLTQQAMGVVTTGKSAAAAILSQAQEAGTTSSKSGLQDCSLIPADTTREVDICGEFKSISDCHGIISDGIGPYAKSADCVVRLAGFLGGRYTLIFEQFELEASVDFLRVFDGVDGSAPLLGEFSGNELPPMLISSGSDLYLRFTSNDNGQAIGFRATFDCSGTPLEYWKPATVATELLIGVPTPQTTLQSQLTACLSDVLLSVQCCADADLSCANARVTGVELSKHQLRGSLPEQLGDLGALRSLKLHDNFLTGTFPASLAKLHWLQELQLSHNQFAMQDRASLSKVLGGMVQLKTLDLVRK